MKATWQINCDFYLKLLIFHILNPWIYETIVQKENTQTKLLDLKTKETTKIMKFIYSYKSTMKTTTTRKLLWYLHLHLHPDQTTKHTYFPQF